MQEIQTEELTDIEKQLLELDTNKKKFNLLNKYLISNEYKNLVEHFKSKWDELFTKIELELDKRRNWERSKATVSDLDKTLSFYDFQIELMNALGNTEAELILKEDLKRNAENTKTHLTNKIDELYDVPSYSELDLLKLKRVEYSLIEDRINTMAWFYRQSEETLYNPNPYEELVGNRKMTEEEFNLMTDIN